MASSRNETHNFTIPDFVTLFAKYSENPRPLDLVLVPGLSQKEFEKKYPDVASRYLMEHAHFLGWEQKRLDEWAKKPDIQIMTHNATTIDPVKFRLRHDPKKLAMVLKKLL
ncbi:MAG: hypothetical protein AAB838_03625 [Patescibacteria group bacterium]